MEKEKVINKIISDWQAIQDQREIESYMKWGGVSRDIAERFTFFEYLENYADEGRLLPSFFGMVDRAVAALNLENDLETIDYHEIWFELNK